jgi:hypothetical protein
MSSSASMKSGSGAPTLSARSMLLMNSCSSRLDESRYSTASGGVAARWTLSISPTALRRT